ncbi:MAG: tetratricopeptide repeat protein [Massilibacteroides sp.]|nr:tetratricopeptide repeat protein [Massilibacteroides sp.]MDD3061852.1 tetratricopeptide repeat protein [Massilibacteroides sp.]MDD4115037.1 tetratricopeptide repeat protein [Massilibacteroides sp.]MDD4660576.1 tetratricopeptide repeat protein [Massilibacteroides sp.]
MVYSKQMISEGKIDEAIARLDNFLVQHPDSDEAYFLRGNAYSKKNDFRQALNNYLRAMELNPNSPARQAHTMLMKIMEFYNKDMYNH